MLKVIIRLFLASIFCCGSSALAQEGVLQAAYNMRNSSAVGFDSRYSVDLLAGRSYECSVLIRFYDFGGATSYFVFNPSVSDPNDNSVLATPNGNSYPPVSAPTEISASDRNLARISLIAETTGNHVVTFSDVNNLNLTTQTIVSSCRETTLFGSYNRFFAGVAIVELENKSTSDIEVSISIINSAGKTIVDKQKSTAKASTRNDVIFADLPASDFGQILITHTAPFGALSGTVAEYDFGANGEITLKRERPLKEGSKN
jgi:hypothetical protein